MTVQTVLITGAAGHLGRAVAATVAVPTMPGSLQLEW